jgi:excinuclease ABC subunit C
LAPPDLILIDGGPPQLGAVAPVLERLGLVDRVDLLGIAKARSVDGRGKGRGEAARGYERLHRAGGGEDGAEGPVVLAPDDPVSHLVARIRDEAHRFAITYYRKLHGDKLVASGLDDVPGVGLARKVALLKHFGSLTRVRQASLDELAACPKIDRRTAQAVHDHLHGLRPGRPAG